MANARQCDLFETTELGCRSQGTNWALGEIRKLLLYRGLVICSLAAGLAWVVAVGVFVPLRRLRRPSDRSK